MTDTLREKIAAALTAHAVLPGWRGMGVKCLCGQILPGRGAHREHQADMLAAALAAPPPDVEKACEVMHDAYEAAATREGWETQERSRKPWADVPEANKATMRAAVRALLDHLAPDAPDAPDAALFKTLAAAGIDTRRRSDGAWEVSRIHDGQGLDALRATLQDFAEHGLRADLTPSVDGRDVYGHMVRYLRRLDAYVRDRARVALTDSRMPYGRTAAPLRVRIDALLWEEPLIVSGIRHDMAMTPAGRGGVLRHDPATPGWGASGCPGDNLMNWVNDLHAAVEAAP